MLISLRNQLRDRNLEIMKFNTKVLNFVDFEISGRSCKNRKILEDLMLDFSNLKSKDNEDEISSSSHLSIITEGRGRFKISKILKI